jgi:tripartite-type tricarboxylate transporter receptor subunit TctC
MAQWFKCMLPAVLVVASWAGAQAQPVADFYRGKTINLLIGTGVGGGYDTYARVLARYYGKHIPGNPSIVPQNVLGGGGIKALTSLYSIVPKDGTYIGTSTPVAILEPLFGDKNLAPYDPTKFTWIGNMDRDATACGAWRTSGIAKFSDMLTRETTFGATNSASYLYQHAQLLKEMLGAKAKIVNGYKGSKEVNLAMHRGEIDAVCTLFVSTARAEYGSDIESGDLRFIIQFGNKNDPFFGDAVNIHDLLKTDEQREIADLIFGQIEMTRPFLAPPGLPAPVAAALRKAFMDTMADPEFLAFAEKIGIAIKPAEGEDVARQFAAFYRAPEHILQKAKALISHK